MLFGVGFCSLVGLAKRLAEEGGVVNEPKREVFSVFGGSVVGAENIPVGFAGVYYVIYGVFSSFLLAV